MLAKQCPQLTKLSLYQMKMTDSEMKDLASEGNLAHRLTHLNIIIENIMKVIAKN